MAEMPNPLSRHQQVAEGVVAAGDGPSIKRLYVDLGEDMWAVGREQPEAIPVLSAPETLPVVTAALAGASGWVLDAGCGPNPAAASELAADPRRQVVALDIGRGTVQTARVVAGRSGRTLLGVVGDVEALPFKTSAFAALLCDDTIEHLPDDGAGVGELARVLRPDGTAVLATPNRDSAVIVKCRMRDRLRRVQSPASDYFVSTSHLREYTWREFESLVEPSFRVHRRLVVGWSQSGKRRLVSKLLRLPGLFRWAQMVVVVATPRGNTS